MKNLILLITIFFLSEINAQVPPLVELTIGCGLAPNNIVLDFSGNTSSFPLPYTGSYYNKDTDEFMNFSIDQPVIELDSLADGEYEFQVVIGDSIFLDFCEIIESNNTLNVNANIVNSCNSDGQIIINVLNGVQPYDFMWGTGDSTNSISNLENGIYKITIVDDIGCNLVDSFEVESLVTHGEHLVFDYCDGQEGMGSILLDINANQSVIWDDEYDTEPLKRRNNLHPGKYCFTVNDITNGCYKNDCIKIKDIQDIELIDVEVIKPCINSSNGSIAFKIVNYENIKRAWWDDNHGLPIFDIENVFRDNLVIGDYTFKVNLTCGKVQSFQFTLDQNCDCAPPNLYGVSVMKACSEISTEGSIAILTYGGATFNWSNGAAGNYIQNLTPGVYTVTITDYEGFVCPYIYDISVGIADPIVLTNSIVEDACNETPTGSIELFIDGGQNPQIIGPRATWDDTDQILGLKRENLYKWTYCATVKDRCEEVRFCEKVDRIKFDPIVNIDRSCNENGSIEILPRYPENVFTYQWSTGSNSNFIDGLEPAEYNVTITDQNNCDTVLTINTSIFEIITEENSCKGMSNGSISIRIYNDGGDPVDILFGDSQFEDSPFGLPVVQDDSSSVIDIDLNDLTGNFGYRIHYVGSDCDGVVFFDFEVGEDDYVPLFSRDSLFEGDKRPTCIFHGVCKEDTIRDMFTVRPTPSAIEGTGCPPGSNSSLLHGCPELGFFCDNVEVHREEGEIIKIRAGQAVELLQALGIGASSKLIEDPCAIRWVCASNPNCSSGLGLSGDFFGGNFSHVGEIDETTGCREAFCKFDYLFGITWFETFTLCDSLDWLPDNYDDIFDTGIEKECEEIVSVDFLELVVSRLEIKKDYPNFDTSEVNRFIINSGYSFDSNTEILNMGEEISLSCSKIIFCVDNFQIIDIEYPDDCGYLEHEVQYVDPFGKLSSIQNNCLPVAALHHSEPAILIYCDGQPKFIDYYGYEFYRRRFDNYDQYLTKKEGETTFEKFVISHDNNGIKYTNAIYNYENRKVLHNFTKEHITFIDSFNYEFFTYDFNDNVVFKTASGEGNTYVYAESHKDFFTLPITGGVQKVKNITKYNSTYSIEIELIGTTVINSTTYGSTTNDTMYLVINTDDQLNVSTVHTFYYSDHVRIKKFKEFLLLPYNSLNTFSGSTSLPSTLINNDVVVVNTISLDVTSAINLSKDLEIIDFDKNDSTNIEHYLISGKGNIQLDGRVIYSNLHEEKFIHVSVKGGILQFLNEYGQQGLDLSSVFLESDEKSNSYLGFNLTDTAYVSSAQYISESNDILINCYDSLGNVRFSELYASPDDEYLKDMIYLNDFIFMGLEIDGITYERKIGELTFTKFVRDQSHAALSFLATDKENLIIRENNFKTYKDRSKTEFKVYPNPTKDILGITFKTPIEEDLKGILVSTNGTVAKEFKLINEATSVSCQDLSQGVYILKIYTDDNLLIGSEKVIIIK